MKYDGDDIVDDDEMKEPKIAEEEWTYGNEMTTIKARGGGSNAFADKGWFDPSIDQKGQHCVHYSQSIEIK